jgi:transcriptional regulator with XRE-family HTH domain
MPLRSIDISLAKRLKDREFRREWFRAELEASVPEMFRDLREEREFTQSELAVISGMKQSAISRFERERDAKWNFETLLRLAEAMDAQLSISVVKAEDVISRYEKEEESGGGSRRASVLDAAGADDSRYNSNSRELPGQNETAPKLGKWPDSERASLLGGAGPAERAARKNDRERNRWN